MSRGNDDGTYFTRSSIGDGILGVLMAHLALAVFWIAGAILMSLIVQYLLQGPYGIGSMVIGSLLIAPTLAWGLAMWLGRYIKQNYQTCGRAFQMTVIVYGIAFFGGLGGCIVIGTLGDLLAKGH